MSAALRVALCAAGGVLLFLALVVLGLYFRPSM